jgi:phosphoenolpyruvate synthase/pyruvate phosphate dikinase
MGNSDSSNPIQFVDAEQTHIFNKCYVPALEKLDLENKEIKVLDFLEFNVNDPAKQLKKHKSAKSETDQIEDKNVLHFVSFEEIFKLNYGTLQVGGKGLRLAQVFCSLNGNGSFSVPTGACLTTAAYSEHLGQFKGLMKEIIANSGDRASKSAAEAKIKELYEKIDHVEFNPQLKPKIEEFLNSLPPNSTVAVRSSATIEDAADFSLAGLCSSFLHVPAKVSDQYYYIRKWLIVFGKVEDVVKRIKECWKSMWQTTMTSFLVRSGKKKLPKMAVVVQQMIQSKSSGVLFTLNPSNGTETDPCEWTTCIDISILGNEEEFYLEAIHGLGEGLVSGEISPTCYTINWVTGQSTRTLEANQKKKYVS